MFYIEFFEREIKETDNLAVRGFKEQEPGKGTMVSFNFEKPAI